RAFSYSSLVAQPRLIPRANNNGIEFFVLIHFIFLMVFPIFMTQLDKEIKGIFSFLNIG
ncbi:MAG: hypothetical protein ACI9SG_001481, partial [Maribacter sp.]